MLDVVGAILIRNSVKIATSLKQGTTILRLIMAK
jgi:hypothetical protein